MNKSGIILINFKSFLNKYFNLRTGSITSIADINETQESNDLSVSFLEENLSLFDNKELLSVKSFPGLAYSLNPNYLKEDPSLAIVHLN